MRNAGGSGRVVSRARRRRRHRPAALGHKQVGQTPTKERKVPQRGLVFPHSMPGLAGDADDSFVDDQRDLRRFTFLPHTGAIRSPCSDCIAIRGIWKGHVAAEQKHARLSMFEPVGRSPRYRAAIAEYIPDQAMVD
jgi:hypothetical protein